MYGIPIKVVDTSLPFCCQAVFFWLPGLFMAIREPIDWPGSRPNSSVWRCHYHGKLQMRMDPTLSNKKTRWLQRTGRVELYLNDDFWGSLGSGSSPSASSSTFATLAFKQLQWQFIKWCQQGRNVGLARYSFILNSCMVSSVALQILVTHALLSKKFQICMPFFFPVSWGEILQIDLRELQIDV